VHQLNGHAAVHDIFTCRVVEDRSRGKGQCRSEALSAGPGEVPPGVGEEGVLRLYRPIESPINTLEVDLHIDQAQQGGDVHLRIAG
jgi:hypothetical protein